MILVPHQNQDATVRVEGRALSPEFLQSPLPRVVGTAHIAGPTSPIDIWRDAEGIPHIRGFIASRRIRPPRGLCTRKIGCGRWTTIGAAPKGDGPSAWDAAVLPPTS